MDETTKGDLFILSQTLLWSLFPIFTILSFSTLGSLYSAAISTFFAGLFFAVVITFKKTWHEVLNKSAWKDILLATFFIGIMFYSLLFLGYRYTTAGNGSIAALMQILFAFVILGLWGKEKITLNGVLGGILMCIGAVIVLAPKASGIRYGDFIIVFASLFPPIGNYFMQKARKKVSSITIMCIRSFISAIFIFIFASFFAPLPTLKDVTSSLIYIIPSGVLFLGFSKILWIEGIHRIPITKANSLSTVTPILTLAFSFFILKEVISFWHLLGVIPMIIGANVILYKKK